MPQRTQQFPRGVIAVTATVIDAFGRTGQATIEVDVTARPSGGITTNEIAIARTLSAAAPDRAYPNPIQASGAGPVVTRQTRANTAVNTRVTSYRAALAHPKNRTPWNILAAILAVLAVVFAMGAYALLHASPLAAVSPHGVTPMSTTTVALTPQITVAPTATPTAGALTPAPTSPPEVFGRFDTPTTALQFFCAGASTTPKTVTFDNNGTAPLNWSANVIDTIGTNVPWATVNPTSGTLTTQAGNSATITVTPAAGFCAATTPASFRIQLTAPNSVPLTIVATHTAATATPSSPTPSPTPTTGP